MGQKTNPIGNRLGIIRGWDSNWYGGRKFDTKLVEDDKIRKYLNVRLVKAGISKVYIERTLKLVTVTIYAAKPGIIIGKAGQEVDKLKEELKKLTSKEVQINISEVKRPELDAVLVASSVARQIEGRVSYRKAIKTAITSTMRVGAEGIKISVSGRIGGAEMARTEHYKGGEVVSTTKEVETTKKIQEEIVEPETETTTKVTTTNNMNSLKDNKETTTEETVDVKDENGDTVLTDDEYNKLKEEKKREQLLIGIASLVGLTGIVVVTKKFKDSDTDSIEKGSSKVKK